MGRRRPPCHFRMRNEMSFPLARQGVCSKFPENASWAFCGRRFGQGIDDELRRCCDLSDGCPAVYLSAWFNHTPVAYNKAADFSLGPVGGIDAATWLAQPEQCSPGQSLPPENCIDLGISAQDKEDRPCAFWVQVVKPWERVAFSNRARSFAKIQVLLPRQNGRVCGHNGRYVKTYQIVLLRHLSTTYAPALDLPPFPRRAKVGVYIVSRYLRHTTGWKASERVGQGCL